MKYSSENMSFEKILLKLFHSEQNERLYKSLCLFASLASPAVISEDLQLPCHLSNICVYYLSCFWLTGDLLWSFCGEETIRCLLTNGTDDVTTSDSTSSTVASWEAAAINGSGAIRDADELKLWSGCFIDSLLKRIRDERGTRVVFGLVVLGDVHVSGFAVKISRRAAILLDYGHINFFQTYYLILKGRCSDI